MLETDNEQFDLAAADLAGFGAKDAPDAMGRVHNKIIFLESCFGLLRHILFPACNGPGPIAECSGPAGDRRLSAAGPEPGRQSQNDPAPQPDDASGDTERGLGSTGRCSNWFVI